MNSMKKVIESRSLLAKLISSVRWLQSSARSGTSKWIHLLASRQSDCWIHQPLSLCQLYALFILEVTLVLSSKPLLYQLWWWLRWWGSVNWLGFISCMDRYSFSLKWAFLYLTQLRVFAVVCVLQASNPRPAVVSDQVDLCNCFSAPRLPSLL